MTRPTRTVASIVTLSILAAACANDAGVRVQSAVPILPETTAPAAPTPTDAPDDTTAPTDTAPTTQAAPPTTVEDVTEPLIIEPELAVSIPFTDVVDADAAKPARDHDGFVAVAFTDIERWWNETFPAVYGDAFEPLDGGLYAGYPERSTPIPGCGEPETNYDDLQLFVAFYCNVGDFMAYDDGDDPDFSLLTPLADAFGPAVMGVVLAHEYGHAIQERIGALDRPIATIITEQQADCFAGAWTGQAYRGESPLLRLGDTDVRAGLLAMLEVRDPVGTNQFTPGGHGSAFDRVGAFQVGFLEGPARCAELLDDPLPLMPNQFQPFSADAILEGNAPYDCDALSPDVLSQLFPNGCTSAPEFLADDLLNFWEVTFADEFGSAYGGFTVQRVDSLASVSCADARRLTPQVVVCPVERVVVYDEPAVLDLYNEFGDFTLGYIYGVAAAELVQLDLGSELAGEDRILLDDCYTGAWVRDITPSSNGTTPRSQRDTDGDGVPDSTVATSPGDLDEAIRMTILLGDIGANVDELGTAFEKIDAFRTGVLGGLAACQAG
ncbi:MAG: neutral zinc metallopeptidase [Ilumatobacter sp.]|nr:neutral zinc metallopeptidase [Ilumatobacter sp.]